MLENELVKVEVHFHMFGALGATPDTSQVNDGTTIIIINKQW